MLEIKDNTVLITKDNGEEDVWKLYFYYEHKERGKTYYFLFKEEDPDSLIVMSTSDGKTLENVTDEELSECEEILEAYENDPEIEQVRR
mgnify:CR=1 FL=1